MRGLSNSASSGASSNLRNGAQNRINCLGVWKQFGNFGVKRGDIRIRLETLCIFSANMRSEIGSRVFGTQFPRRNIFSLLHTPSSLRAVALRFELTR
jgi:hypothetical protein